MSWRIVQINSVLQKGVAEYAAREAVGGKFIITVTYVNTVADLSSAEVGIKVFPSTKENLNQAYGLLRKNQKELQLQLARKHKLKNIPKFHFVEDQTSDKVDRVDELLNKVDNERR